MKQTDQLRDFNCLVTIEQSSERRQNFRWLSNVYLQMNYVQKQFNIVYLGPKTVLLNERRRSELVWISLLKSLYMKHSIAVV